MMKNLVLLLLLLVLLKPIYADIFEAAENGDLKAVQQYIENDADLNAIDLYDRTALDIATEEGHLEIVKLFIEKGTNPNNINKALSGASYNGRLEIAQYLVKNGANVNTRDEQGRTALMWASRNGHLEIVKYLVKNGADINTKMGGEYPFTALMFARDYGHTEVVEYLESIE